ncbi:MAG: universal stress protein [Methanomethylovorans sp.]|uniref:universal stress protein n=1 Tax=Methanomethylovorans sp. TaxID=2758717 RepID=UPI000A3DBAD4|nr:universal stress protein [Methanomethylovorans sp.]
MTAEFKKIFVATDGSEQNRRAIEYSIELAKIAGGKIFVGYVVDTAAFASIPMDAGWEMMYGLLKTEASDAVQKVEQLAKQADVEVETVILEGHPSNEIIEFAQKNGMDVIVVGTLGKSGLDRFLLGSVAEKVTRNSPVPVLVVKGASSMKE